MAELSLLNQSGILEYTDLHPHRLLPILYEVGAVRLNLDRSSALRHGMGAALAGRLLAGDDVRDVRSRCRANGADDAFLRFLSAQSAEVEQPRRCAMAGQRGGAP